MGKELRQTSGLGLAVAQNCLELNGDSIEVASEVGVGTTFAVTAPNCRHPDAIPLLPNATQPAVVKHSRPRLLWQEREENGAMDLSPAT
ncbi:HAMP domain-containing histidine kinase [Rubidibacter lacunae]|uniref:HAMP domain-containing histidine kinase n=1 Tax=Rubidibacter lacunae TaxID=582514 RepID=UPI00041C3369|nr:HAMP domain-containing histidine kinase [Rubidibacter lacunae]